MIANAERRNQHSEASSAMKIQVRQEACHVFESLSSAGECILFLGTRNDGGPSLSMISSSIKTKGKLKDIILEVLNSAQNRGPRTASSTAVQWPVRHPGCSPSTLPGFVVQIS